MGTLYEYPYIFMIVPRAILFFFLKEKYFGQTLYVHKIKTHFYVQLFPKNIAVYDMRKIW
jgi:hypothetical protein